MVDNRDRTVLAITGPLVAVAAVFAVLTFYQARQVRLGLPVMCAGLDSRMTDLQHHEAASIDEFRQDVNAARHDAADAAKQVAELKGKVAGIENTTGEQAKFRSQTTARLNRIEQSLAQANRTVEHVDRKVEQVIPTPPPKPSWWRW